ncbi:MAG: hypothetical protein IH934_03850 [Nanoarchaeota archaeon]|nr:hypothetical protein [Nanoarchaeota archaeon]
MALRNIFGQRDIITQIEKDPNSVPQIYLADIAVRSAREFERLRTTEQIGAANEHLRIARTLAHHIYTNREGSGNIVYPQLLMDEGATEGGVLGLNIDPNREYRNEPGSHLILKRTDSERGRQAFLDSKHFQGDQNLNLEYVVSNVPYDGATSYLWKEFIIGPNLSDLLVTLDHGIARGNEEERRLCIQLEEELTEIAAKRILHWQQNAPELESVPKDPEAVIRTYKMNLVEILRGFSQFTDIDFTDGEIDEFRQALDHIDFSCINQKTVVRNMAATYKNMVLATGQLNVGYPRIIDLFTQNGGRRRVDTSKIEDRLYIIDTASKYSHFLEEPQELDQSMEGQHKKSAVNSVRRSYRDNGLDFTPREVNLMGVYRAYRKAFLVLTEFGYRNFEKFQTGKRNFSEFDVTHFNYREQLNHLLLEGQKHLGVLSRNYVHPSERDPFNTISVSLLQLGTYKTIDYQKPSPSNGQILAS